MLENTSRNLRILAGAVGVTLALGVAVGVGAVPQLGDSGAVRTAAVSEAEQVAAPAAPATNVVPAAPQAPTTAAADPSTTVAKPAATTPPTTKAPAAKTTKPAATPTTAAPATATPAAAAPAPAAPVSTVVPRRTPTAAEVQAAITELKKRVGGVLLYMPISPAQIDQVGDQVCTAFDGGATVSQVKSTALSMIPSSIVVSAATTDWAVREAVTLYCPGYLSKLS